MALRMILVGVVACLGLNQSNLHGSDETSRVATAGSALGIGLIGALVEIGPVVPVCAVEMCGTALAEAEEGTTGESLIGWPWDGCLGEAVAVVEATEMTCVAERENAGCVSRICEVVEVAEAEPVEVIVVEEERIAADADAGFLVAVDSILDDFLSDRVNPLMIEEELVPAPPALEAEAIIEPAATIEPVVFGFVAQAMPEPLYPEVVETECPAPAAAPADVATESVEESPESVEEVTTAVRLTGQAIAAWGRIFVQTGPVRR